MTFEENPFRVLQVSIYADKATINERADELSFEDPDREEIIEQARTILLNPKKRIAAEMRWFVGCSHAKELKYIANYLAKVNPDYNDDYPSFADLNYRIYSLEYLNTEEKLDNIASIDAEYSGLDVEEIREQINAARAKSKFPAVQDTVAIKTELKNIRYEMRGIIQDVLKNISRDESVKVANDFAEAIKYLDDGEFFGVIVEDFFDSYRLEINPFLEETTKQIISILTKIKINADAKFIYALKGNVEAFANAIKPLDKVSIALSTNNFDNAENIFYEVRNTAINLFNEKDLIDYPLQIIKILEQNFSYLPTLAELIRKDVNFLEEAKAHRPTKSFLDAKAALDKIQEAMNKNLHFARGFEDNNLDFYLHVFRVNYEGTLKQLMFRRNMKTEEWRTLNAMAAVIYIKIGTAMTWTHFHPKTVLELFQKALPYATDSGDKELISIAYKKVDEWRKINERIYSNSKESSWNFKLLFAISIIVIIWLIAK